VVKASAVSVLVLASVACAAGSAQAQAARSVPAPQPASLQAAAPWYERFTFGTESGSGANAWTPRAEQRSTLRVAPNSRWGLTFGMDPDAVRPTDPRGQRTSAGVSYDISPRVRVGTEVTLPARGDQDADVRRRGQPRAEEPGVRVRSAFRF
jgi:hypothetical protein